MKQAEFPPQSESSISQPPRPWTRAFRRLVSREHLLGHIKGYVPQQIPIATKLAITFILLIGCGMILLGLLVGANQSQLLEKQMGQFGSTLAYQLGESSKEPLLASDPLGLELILNSLAKQPNVLGTAALSEEGVPVVSNGLVPPLNTLRNSGIHGSQNKAAHIEWQAFEGIHNGTPLITFIEPVRYKDLTAGYALITFDLSMLNEARNDTITTVIVTIILMLAISIAASFVLAQRLTKPITDLMHMGKAIQQGDYKVRLDERRNDELGILMDSMNSMSHGLLRKAQVEQVFSRYVSPQVARRVLNDLEKMEQVKLGGGHVNASVIFADIVGFTTLSEKLGPQESSQLLNIYFSHIAQAVSFCHGHVDKYIGDCAMIVFGVPEERDDHTILALRASWMIMRLVEALNVQRRIEEKITVEFRIGVNSGQMIAGNMGSAQRMEYTVVGDAVNLASRLSHAGGPGEIILLEDMLTTPNLEQNFLFESFGNIRLRGKEEPVNIIRLSGMNGEFPQTMHDEIAHILHEMSGVTA